MDFMIGGLAGAGATIFTNPMDVVKTRMQLQGELCARTDQAVRRRGMLHELYLIARTEGFLALQQGLAPAILLGFTMHSVTLGTYHVAEVRGWTQHRSGELSLHKSIFWSSAGGVVSGVVSNPAFVLKTRIQASSHPSLAEGTQHKYNGMLDGFTTIYKTEGVKGFFAGVSATCARLAVGSGAQLSTFSAAKRALLEYKICEYSPLMLAFSASALSGVMVAVAVCPFDVITVRLYNQGSANSGEQLYNGLLDCSSKIYKTEGLHGFYKGLGPLYLRIAPQTTLSLVIWDMLNNLLLNNKSSL